MIITASKTVPLDRERKSSILYTINVYMVLIFLALVIFSIPITYFITSNEVQKSALTEMETLNSYVGSVRKFVREENSDYFIAKNEWHLTAVSPIVAAKAVAKRYMAENANIRIRFISDNPLNQENAPNQAEMSLLQRLRQSKSAKLESVSTIDGEQYLMQATPEVMKPACNACHGDITNAPKAQLALYKGTGYNWILGDTVGATIIGVKMQNVTIITLQRTGWIVLGTTLVFAMVLAFINLMLQKTVLSPLVRLTEYANGVVMNEKPKMRLTKRNDEIGILTGVLERLQLSFNILHARLASSKQPSSGEK